MKSICAAGILGLIFMGAAHAIPVPGTYDNLVTAPDGLIKEPWPNNFPLYWPIGSEWQIVTNEDLKPAMVFCNKPEGYVQWLIVNDTLGAPWAQFSNWQVDPWYTPGDPIGNDAYTGSIVDFSLTADFSDYYTPEWSNGMEVAGYVELAARIVALFEVDGDAFYGTFELSYTGFPFPYWTAPGYRIPWYSSQINTFGGYYGWLDSATLTIESVFEPEPEEPEPDDPQPVVPEPASMTLMGLGVAALAFKAARKRSRAE
ncbi:MAG TPA: PEP-CTERM sorting domain-containing protein [Candidatus Hydrogenedentes bacterium]|jgi:hypothetical protein|nr:PEP-CTERM sorting domain-containing protein [Candidatus Hydrogenedentota bacterium]